MVQTIPAHSLGWNIAKNILLGPNTKTGLTHMYMNYRYIFLLHTDAQILKKKKNPSKPNPKSRKNIIYYDQSYIYPRDASVAQIINVIIATEVLCKLVICSLTFLNIISHLFYFELGLKTNCCSSFRKWVALSSWLGWTKSSQDLRWGRVL